MWTILDLNTRETATLAWGVFVLVLGGANDDIRSSLKTVLGTAVKPSIRVLLATTGIWAGAIILALDRGGYWRSSMIPATVAWFGGTAIVGTFSMGGVRELRRLVTRTVALTAVVEFVSNAYTFPLPIELLLVPAVVTLLTMARFAQITPEFAQITSALRAIVVVVFIGTLTPTIVFAAEHANELTSTERTQEFLLPFVLTAAFVPYLYLVRMVVAWQTTLSMLKSGMAGRPQMYAAAKSAVICSCRLSLSRIRLFEPEFRWQLQGASSEEDLRRVMSAFRRASVERPWRHSDETGDASSPPINELLPGASGSSIFVQSITLAQQVNAAVADAAEGLGLPEDRIRAVLDRLNAMSELSAASAVGRAEMISVLARRGRSAPEIETMAPQLGMLATMHGVDLVWLAAKFDAMLRLGQTPATSSRRVAEELHGMSAFIPLRESIDAFIRLLGGEADDQESSP